jgi:hypothetical protein
MEWHASAAMPLIGSREQTSRTEKALPVAKIRFIMNDPSIITHSIYGCVNVEKSRINPARDIFPEVRPGGHTPPKIRHMR